MRSVLSLAAYPDSFALPREVFQLSLKQSPLLVYLYLICRKSSKHGADEMNCAAIGKAIGLCEKTVQKHVHSLISKGLIQAEDATIRRRDGHRYNGSLLYTVKPIEQILKDREKEALAVLKLAEAQRKWGQRCQPRDRPRSAL